MTPIFSRSVIAAAVAAACLAVTTARAQSANAPGQAKKTDPAVQATAQATLRAGMSQAKELIKGKNLNAVEATLGALNHAKPNTAAWHIELAQRLIQIADQLARESNTAQVASTANLAVQHLTQADGLAKDAVTHGTIKSLTGFIQEHFLADQAAALASYQAAAKYTPKATAAQEAAARISQTQEAANARGKQPGN